ncbi:hypothetical protein HNR59_003952 [Aquamicrobium lusatiense]|uniref:Uncharacterized protein n=1 Tax=Aquamicrobium lusatiense TaxID=89772 RepID=A0A7W9S5M7_9HYPH|nr:hypothetical protein [Aquamicrobium lusatiense]
MKSFQSKSASVPPDCEKPDDPLGPDSTANAQTSQTQLEIEPMTHPTRRSRNA